MREGMVDTLKVGGIKLSDELVQIEIHESAPCTGKLMTVLRQIAAAEVTIPHLHQIHSSGQVQTTLCVAAEEYKRLFEAEFTELREEIRIIPCTGTITIFPHRFSLELFSRVTSALARADIPCLGVSSSISALVMHCPFSEIDRAVAAVLTECELPQNHTPLRPVVLLGDQPVETVAKYWEPKIRIYGMEVQNRLTRISWQLRSELCRENLYRQIGSKGEKFSLLLGQYQENSVFHGELLTTECWQMNTLQTIRAILTGDFNLGYFKNEKVDLVTFHGPHFHDRYGIAERVFVALQKVGIDLLLSGCTGTSVHLVVGVGQGNRTAECLAEVCIVPH